MNGTLFSTRHEIKAQAMGYFAGLFKKAESTTFSLEGIPFKSLCSDQSIALSCPFAETDIYEALISYGSTKAPGPDGLNFLFYKRAWRIMKPDIIAVSFFQNSLILESSQRASIHRSWYWFQRQQELAHYQISGPKVSLMGFTS